MRKRLIAGNWKMNMTTIEAGELTEAIIKKTEAVENIEIVIAPPFTALEAVNETIGDAPIWLAAQNVHWENSGAYTGEISCKMLIDIGCRWVITGHSERREYFGDSNDTVNKRTKAAISAGLKAIVCIGETLEEREADKTTEIIAAQLSGSLAGISESEFQNVVIAYEPIWAIGTGKTATKEEAQEIHLFIRNWLKDNISAGVAESTRILYGGSVKPANATELLSQPDIDGALVGGASLKADDFSAIISAS